ncbi:MAG: trypsin-like peptidase domain-containing protein, partial [Leptolyngbyaceae cyanobacterium bins.302]|nr:trypsin-like peptidase domain-containing protein [Leptolyngbyaceae cyanobacterium bins.302]
WSVGTGFIIDPKGLILTNAHLVGRTKKVTVVLTDGRRFSGEVKGVDTLTDLAVVKVDPGQQKLPVARVGNVNQIKNDDSVTAVGDLDSNVNLGIVSNFNRLNTKAGIPDTRLDVIQTYTAVDPDYSGGPLLNQAGEVIGINTSIRSVKPGIGFAIPIDTATAIAQKLATGKQVTHPFLGIHVATLTPELAREINRSTKASKPLPEISGIRVLQVFPYTPAAEAGMRPGDVIIAINQKPITTPSELQQEISQLQVGQASQVTMQRNDQTINLAVRVDDLQNQRGKWLVTPLRDQLMTH